MHTIFSAVLSIEQRTQEKPCSSINPVKLANVIPQQFCKPTTAKREYIIVSNGVLTFKVQKYNPAGKSYQDSST